MDDVTDHEQDRSGDKGRHVGSDDIAEDRIDAKRDEEIVGGVHAEHHEIALGEIDDPHHAENQREANAHQSVDRAEQQAGCQRLQYVFEELRDVHGGGLKLFAAVDPATACPDSAPVTMPDALRPLDFSFAGAVLALAWRQECSALFLSD